MLDRLRTVFDHCESMLLQQGEHFSLCADLRRQRRSFIDNYLAQLSLCCDDHDRDWVVGTAAGASQARTLIYLAGAEESVRELFQQQPEETGKLAALWIRHTGAECTALTCPLSPHTLARLFFLLLPDLSVPLRIRFVVGEVFCAMLPDINQLLLTTISNLLQRLGVQSAAVAPLLLPEWWEPLDRIRMPSAAVRAMLVQPDEAEAVETLSVDLAQAALAGDATRIQQLLASGNPGVLQSWLAVHLSPATAVLPQSGCTVLQLLAGPLLLAACDEYFADAAHPARSVMEKLSYWLQGWYDCHGDQGSVPDICLELATDLARALVHNPEARMQCWMELLDYLLQLKQQIQKDTAAIVASTRLSLQVLEVRAEVEALFANRAGQEYWPEVVIEILRDYWCSLLLGIHWREGTASDAWLSALALADELMASVLPLPDRESRQRMMLRIPQLLQGLRRGFDTLGCGRRSYGILLHRLEQVHLAVLQGKSGDALTENRQLWPVVTPSPRQDDVFAVGSWLRREDGSVVSVQFSDSWCTVLLDTRHAALECFATAQMRAFYREGNLVQQSMLSSLLPAT